VRPCPVSDALLEQGKPGEVAPEQIGAAAAEAVGHKPGGLVSWQGIQLPLAHLPVLAADPLKITEVEVVECGRCRGIGLPAVGGAVGSGLGGGVGRRVAGGGRPSPSCTTAPALPASGSPGRQSLAGESHGMHASPFAWRDTVEQRNAMAGQASVGSDRELHGDEVEQALEAQGEDLGEALA
jgi:hypothetical protein